VNAATITVNSTADTTGGVPCTLRDAILAANTNAASGGCAAGGASDVIAFAIPAATDPGCNAGTGVCVIKPLTQTPFVTGLVDINGFTQPGASANTLPGGAYPNAQGLDTQIRIEVDGSLEPAGTTGLVFNAGSTGSRVRGLAVLSFHTQMILNVGTIVTGNYVGTRADGVTRGRRRSGSAAMAGAPLGRRSLPTGTSHRR
jgi:CSLREA domain-containing protein